MSDSIWIALLGIFGSAIGTFGGILTSAKLTNYRIQQLEEKLSTISNAVSIIPLLEEKIKVLNHRLDETNSRVDSTNSRIDEIEKAPPTSYGCPKAACSMQEKGT